MIPLILRSANRKSVLELHNRTGEDACPEQRDGNVDAHLKRQNHDYEVWLEELAPHAPVGQCRPRGRLRNRAGEDNADAHLKRQIMGRDAVLKH